MNEQKKSPLKTYGITVLAAQEWGAQSQQVRVVVAAPSQAKAVAALQRAGLGNLTVGHLRKYGGHTRNEVETEVAEAEPGTVFWHEDRYPRPAEGFHPVRVSEDRR